MNRILNRVANFLDPHRDDARIADIEAENRRLERENDDAWSAYIISKKLQRFKDEENK